MIFLIERSEYVDDVLIERSEYDDVSMLMMFLIERSEYDDDVSERKIRV